MLKHIIKHFSVALVLIGLLAINGCKEEKKDNNVPQTDSTTQTQPAINEEALNEIISSFPQPVEMAALINDLQVPFAKKYLIDPKQTENYDTNNKKALALGILSADLGYLNIYGRSTLIVEYLSSIKKIADELRVGQFFDFQALKRMATNNNLDTLIYTSLQNFTAMHQHLSQTGRSNLSLLMVTGVWLEGLYLLCEVAEDSQKNTVSENFQQHYQKLKEKIGEQKTLFNILYKVLILYKDDPYFEELISNLNELKSIYDNVTITIQQGEKQVDTVDGRIVIYQDEESSVNITDEQVNAIIKTTKKIRNKLINL